MRVHSRSGSLHVTSGEVRTSSPESTDAPGERVGPHVAAKEFGAVAVTVARMVSPGV
jgi:hypothetical protein